MPCQGLYHHPTGQPPKTALIATHYNVDFSEHYLGELMAARGYGFLGWNTRFRGNEGFFLLEHALIDIGAGVRWLRESAGVDQVVILGNSGGGSLMGAYLSQAQGVTMTPTPGLQAARRCARPAGGGPVRLPMRSHRPAGGADRLVRSIDHGRGGSNERRFKPEHVRSGQWPAVFARVRGPLPQLPKRPATTGSPSGAMRNLSSTQGVGPVRPGVQHVPHLGGPAAHGRHVGSIRARGRRVLCRGSQSGELQPARHWADQHRCALGCRCGAFETPTAAGHPISIASRSPRW